jgi:hypothetical protein
VWFSARRKLQSRSTVLDRKGDGIVRVCDYVNRLRCEVRTVTLSSIPVDHLGRPITPHTDRGQERTILSQSKLTMEDRTQDSVHSRNVTLHTESSSS